MWLKNYSQTLFQVIKIEHIFGSIFSNFTQSAFIVCQVQHYRGLLKLSCRPIVFTTYIKKRSTLTKIYFKNGKTENDLENLNIISNECTKRILDSKGKHVRQMS